MSRSRSSSSSSPVSHSPPSHHFLHHPISGHQASTSTSAAQRAARFALLLGVARQVVSTPDSQPLTGHTETMATPANSNNGENAPLLTQPDKKEVNGNTKARVFVWTGITVLFAIALVFFLGFAESLNDTIAPWIGLLPKDPYKAALVIMKKAPIIDGHIDLPILVRSTYANNITDVDLESLMPGHVDIPRLRKGHVGGFFWSAYVQCAKHEDEGEDFIDATWIVRDTLEQIDVARELIAKYPNTFQLATTSVEVEEAISNGKIASLIGIEGAHQLGNSIAVLRQYHALGVRYVTLTHTCHNAFADSCGFLPGIIPRHYGLSKLGRSLIEEMNRLGVLVDLSHTSDETAHQAIQYSKAPVIWSHSSSRAVHDVPRNVPDYILRLIGKGEGQNDAVVMVNFAPFFVANPGRATVEAVADHIDHIADVAGKEHVGIGSDYDGIGDTPIGLEDVSTYPALIAELFRRGWNKYDLAGLTGGNLLRILRGAEKTARELQLAGIPAAYDLYDKRPDLPWRGDL